PQRHTRTETRSRRQLWSIYHDKENGSDESDERTTSEGQIGAGAGEGHAFGASASRRSDEASPSRFRDEICKGVSAICSESGKQKPYEKGSRPNHLLVDRL